MKTIALLLVLALPAVGQGELLFQESFEDTLWAQRNWYDANIQVAPDADAPDGDMVMVWHWDKAGAVGTTSGSSRAHLPPLEDVTLGFWMKVSDNWEWTGVPWHPHMFNVLTNADDQWVGPAWTHLTTYAEVVNGIPRLALQDGRNIDTSAVRQDITAVTEARAVAGCNGDADGHGEGADCYPSGDRWANGKVFSADTEFLVDEPGPRYKGDWHEIRARYRLNRVGDGVTHHDGVLQMWFDGALIIDVQDAVLRTSVHPDMRFDQLFMAGYFGPGVPHAQTMWIDDVRVWAGPPPATAVQPTSWGKAKTEGNRQQ